jgi:hypothetical protein
MPRKGDIDALGQQALATTLTPSRKSRASAFCAHASAKAMLLFAGPFRSLQSAFHIVCPRPARKECLF